MATRRSARPAPPDRIPHAPRSPEPDEIRARWRPFRGGVDNESWTERWVDSVDDDVRIDRLDIDGSLITANLGGARLTAARVIDTRLHEADLPGATFTGSSFHRVEFVGCRMWGVQFDDCTFRDVRFVDCLLDDANFRMTDAEHVEFLRGRCDRADFTGARWAGCRWVDCDLSGVTFTQADLRESRFPGSLLDGVIGATALAGASIDETQASSVGRALLAAHGIRVLDPPQPAARLGPSPER